MQPNPFEPQPLRPVDPEPDGGVFLVVVVFVVVLLCAYWGLR